METTAEEVKGVCLVCGSRNTGKLDICWKCYGIQKDKEQAAKRNKRNTSWIDKLKG